MIETVAEPQWRAVVIEDQPALVALYEAMLEGGRIRFVEGALTARAGMEAVRRHRPDLVILDLGLPDRDGLEILPDLVASGATVAVVSAFGHEGARKEAARRGAAAFIEKGGSLSALQERLESILEQRTAKGQPAPS